MKAVARLLLVALTLAGGVAGASVKAAEPARAFLDALRQREYYDEAFDYLEQLRANPQLAASLRDRLLYEQAATVLASASGTSDPKVRRTRLSRAAELFEEFSTKHPRHALVGSARNQLGTILTQHGRAEAQAADGTTKKEAAGRAREQFEAAQEQFTSAVEHLDEQLASMPKLVAPDDNASRTRKRELSGALAEARLLRAGIDFELAETYQPASSQAKDHIASAAKSYAAIYETYRTRAAGLLARLWEGRCYRRLGKNVQALGCYRELMDLPDADETFSIKTKATRRALECWTSDAVKNYQAAIEHGGRWEKASARAATDADALAIRYLIALAYQKQSKSLPDKDPNREKLVGFARQHVDAVVRHPGEFQRPAKMLLVALRSGETAPAAGGGSAAPATFAEAYEAAQQELAAMQGASAALAAGVANAVKADALRTQKSDSAQRAIALLRLALALQTDETPAEDANSARYYLCYACWDSGRYEDAAVLGEFLAQRAPDTLPGRQGARIALAAYVRLYSEADAVDRSFEVSQIQRIAEMTFRRWPDEQEAEEAALTMVNFAAAAGQIEKATEYLQRISADSPRRGQAELRAGQTLWSSYLRALRLPDEDRPPREKLDALKAQAREILNQGIARVDESGKVDATLASAAFSLAQIRLENGETNEAISVLEHPTYGPLTLVASGNPAAARGGFAIETYKMALRAFVAASPQQLEKAEQAMDALEKLVQGSGDQAAAENLTAIYISLGRQLQEHLQELRKSGKTEELDSVSKAFEVFLDRVVKRNAGGNYASLNWVGETYYSLGAGFDEGGSSSSPRAQSYFQKATTAYQRMLEMAGSDPKFQKNPDSLISLRLRLADCYQRGGKFDQAIKTIGDVLKDRQMLLSAQVRAAEIYQAQGAIDPKAYAMAIRGSLPKPDGRNLIWGWGKISKMTMNDRKFEETFHKARLNLADSRHRYALKEEKEARRKAILEAAVQDLWSTYKLRPRLGGPQTTALYDRTLKRIQRTLGKPQIGLKEFQQRDAARATAAE